ncbi:hypothetical protein M569_02121, partial [Genlisea aurea]
MEPDLGALCASLSIRDDEESSSIVPKALLGKNPSDGGFYLVGRVVSKKVPKVESLANALQFAFKANHGLEVRKLDENRFLFRFNDGSEAAYVLQNGPWHYDKFTLVLAQISDGENPYAANLTWCDFNIKVHNLPVLSIKREIAEFLGNEIGRFKEADIPRNGFCVDNRLKMRVSINTDLPLKRMIRLNLEDGTSAIIPITYERLQNFCFVCGKLDHLLKDCVVASGEGSPQFGPWLRDLPKFKAKRNLKNEQADGNNDSNDSTSSPSPQGKCRNEKSVADFSDGSAHPHQGSVRVEAQNPRKEFSERFAGVGSNSSQEHSGAHNEELMDPNRVAIQEDLVSLPIVPMEVTMESQGRFVLLPALCYSPMHMMRRRLLSSPARSHEYTRGKSGGLALLWLGSIIVDIKSFSTNHIDAVISPQDGSPKWRLTGFYGNPLQASRSDSWSLLTRLHHQFSLPWLVVGDFNEVLWQDEHLSSCLRSCSSMGLFRNALEECDLSDLGFQGYPFTWTNNRTHPSTVKARLDRFVANTSWINIVPHFSVSHLKFGGSDHCPILLMFKDVVGCHTTLRRKRFFKFEKIWCENETCRVIIDGCWAVPRSSWCPQLSLLRRLQNCRQKLQCWHRTSIGSLRHRISSIQDRLSTLMEGVISDSVGDQIRDLKAQLSQLLKLDEIWWKQRSKVHWLREGDKNNKFFHGVASSRQRRNKIERLKSRNNIWLENTSDIHHEFISVYEDLFKSTYPSEDAINNIVRTAPRMVTDEMNRKLTQAFTSEEILTAVMQMNADSAPGPDGFPPLFYQKFWPTIGSEVCNSVLDFLNNRKCFRKFNHTNIVFIPKVSDPVEVAHYRPISLCNVIYKMASKCITNRLKEFVSEIISPWQSAFVPDRLITDNILVAFEVNHSIRNLRRGKKSFVSLKLDMNKAYDRVEWSFLKAMLIQLGFHISFVELILLAVSSVSYSLVINGDRVGLINPQRGLRQGDPLSPYLFLFCAEGLSSALRAAEQSQSITGFRVTRRGPSISHLFFADDAMIFCEASCAALSRVSDILQDYERASGQKVNTHKSAMVFSPNTPDSEKEIWSRGLGFLVKSHHDIYLGLPSLTGSSKKRLFSGLLERVNRKIEGWNSKFLSQAGKLVLIKAVLQAIPAYTMSCFALPKSFLGDLQSAISRYWWRNRNGKGIHWKSWDFISRSFKEGGLGFRDLHDFNLALLGKQVWRIASAPHSILSRVFRAKYFPNGDIWTARPCARGSYVWNGIMKSRDLVSKGIRHLIGDGSSVDIWHDPWIPKPPTFKPTNLLGERRRASVATLIDSRTKWWDVGRIREKFDPVDANHIISIPLSESPSEDKILWHYSKSGTYTVRSAYHLVRSLRVEVSSSSSDSRVTPKVWDLIWKHACCPKIGLFMWRLAHGCLPTNETLWRRRIPIDKECSICLNRTESDRHILLECPPAIQVWALSDLPWGAINTWRDGASAIDWISSVSATLKPAAFSRLMTIAWFLWWKRNSRIHEGAD